MLNYAAVGYSKIITIEPGKRGGKPCIRGMRITVQDVFEIKAGFNTFQRDEEFERILEEHLEYVFSEVFDLKPTSGNT